MLFATVVLRLPARGLDRAFVRFLRFSFGRVGMRGVPVPMRLCYATAFVAMLYSMAQGLGLENGAYGDVIKRMLAS